MRQLQSGFGAAHEQCGYAWGPPGLQAYSFIGEITMPLQIIRNDITKLDKVQ